ncbi:MAG TPA: RNA polymerase sigma factor [Thermoanaerobaculia bacterium]
MRGGSFASLRIRLGDRALAEDILQDAFVRSIEKGDDIRDPSSAVAWFYRMLRNAVIDHHRRRLVRSKALDAFAGEMKDAVAPPPELTSEICGCVREIAHALKPEYASAIERVDVEEMSVQDYAASVGITANNAGVRLSRAREALRKE